MSPRAITIKREDLQVKISSKIVTIADLATILFGRMAAKQKGASLTIALNGRGLLDKKEIANFRRQDYRGSREEDWEIDQWIQRVSQYPRGEAAVEYLAYRLDAFIEEGAGSFPDLQSNGKDHQLLLQRLGSVFGKDGSIDKFCEFYDKYLQPFLNPAVNDEQEVKLPAGQIKGKPLVNQLPPPKVTGCFSMVGEKDVQLSFLYERPLSDRFGQNLGKVSACFSFSIGEEVIATEVYFVGNALSSPGPSRDPSDSDLKRSFAPELAALYHSMAIDIFSAYNTLLFSDQVAHIWKEGTSFSNAADFCHASAIAKMREYGGMRPTYYAGLSAWLMASWYKVLHENIFDAANPTSFRSLLNLTKEFNDASIGELFKKLLYTANLLHEFDPNFANYGEGRNKFREEIEKLFVTYEEFLLGLFKKVEEAAQEHYKFLARMQEQASPRTRPLFWKGKEKTQGKESEAVANKGEQEAVAKRKEEFRSMMIETGLVIPEVLKLARLKSKDSCNSSTTVTFKFHPNLWNDFCVIDATLSPWKVGVDAFAQTFQTKRREFLAYIRAVNYWQGLRFNDADRREIGETTATQRFYTINKKQIKSIAACQLWLEEIGIKDSKRRDFTMLIFLQTGLFLWQFLDTVTKCFLNSSPVDGINDCFILKDKDNVFCKTDTVRNISITVEVDGTIKIQLEANINYSGVYKSDGNPLVENAGSAILIVAISPQNEVKIDNLSISFFADYPDKVLSKFFDPDGILQASKFVGVNCPEADTYQVTRKWGEASICSQQRCADQKTFQELDSMRNPEVKAEMILPASNPRIKGTGGGTR